MVWCRTVSNGVEWCGVKWCQVSVMTLESLLLYESTVIFCSDANSRNFRFFEY